MPERNQDERISVIMADWTRQVAPEVMAKARDVAPADMQLTGVHPPLDASTDDIPGACLKCHADPKAKAPDLVALLHTIHLTGGDENHFLSIFQGECTHCHKMNATSGVWMVPGGAEK